MAFLTLLLGMIQGVNPSPSLGSSRDDLELLEWCARTIEDKDSHRESSFDLDLATADTRIDLVTSPPPDSDLPFSLRVSPTIRWISGHVTVRENAIQGTRLDLDRDLGLRTAAGANAEFDIDRPGVQFQMEVEDLFGWGGHPSRNSFNWNGTTFLAPAQVRDHSSFLTVRPTIAVKALAVEKADAWLGPVVGLEYPYYTVSVSTNREKGSLEDWVHYLPYPVIGLAGHMNLAESFSLNARFTAGYLPNVPVPYIEGGRLYVSARPSIFLEVPLIWRLGPSFDLSCTLTYQYWSGRDHSNEDGNTLTISSPGMMVGLDYHW